MAYARMQGSVHLSDRQEEDMPQMNRTTMATSLPLLTKQNKERELLLNFLSSTLTSFLLILLFVPACNGSLKAA